MLRRKGNHEVVKYTRPMYARVMRSPLRRCFPQACAPLRGLGGQGSWPNDVRIRSIPPMSWVEGRSMLVTLDEGVPASPMGIWLGV